MMRTWTDSTLMSMKKSDLIECLRCAEYNQTVAEEQLAQHIENVKDWVPVVRCKDCEYWGDESGRMHTPDGRLCDRCEAHSYLVGGRYIGLFPKENDFCSYGKRR